MGLKMSEKLSREDVAVLIRARQLSRQLGVAPDADIKTICEHAGISRKTGYQWADNFSGGSDSKQQLERELEQLKAEKESLEKKLKDVRFENEGRKLAWEIHQVDELLAAKKNSTAQRKNKKP